MTHYYCFPDIHGEIEILDEALEAVYARQNGGKIIFLGDYIDRGKNNLAVLNRVQRPPKDWEFVCLKGNHEDMFVNSYMSRENFYDHKAAMEIAGFDDPYEFPMPTYEMIHSSISEELIRWMNGLKIFHIEDKNVFAHAFYDDMRKPEEQLEKVCLWDRLGDSEKYWNDNQGLFLTHGHTPRMHAPVRAINRINLDAGAVFYGRYVVGVYQKDIQGPVDFIEIQSDKYKK